MTTGARYVSENSGQSSYTFWISSSRSCGSLMGQVPGDASRTELSNTIIVQNDLTIQEIWDVARTISCDWVDNYVKTVNFNPFTVGMLQSQEVRFQGDQPIECWMDLQLGKWPDISDINSIVKIGDSLSLLVYARDNDFQYDVSVKDCYAFAGPDFDNPNTARLQLTDFDGCVIKDKLISQFYTAREVDGRGSIIVSYAFVNAFKFPDVMDVFMTCNVEICKGDCDSKCSATTITTAPPRRSGSTLFGEPIYTTKPTPACFPGSTNPECGPVVTTQPTIIIPKCYPGSNNPNCPTPPPQKIGKELSPQITTTRCFIGSNDPKCPPICDNDSIDPRCPKPPPPTTTVAPTTTKTDCSLGSLNPNCETATKDGRFGSILFPATITTTPSTTTTELTTRFIPITVPFTKPSTVPTTKRRSGNAIFGEPINTTPPAPKLKPTTTTSSPPLGKQLNEPKSKPEPTGKEWEGESQYHAFHNFHFQKGDGRRSRIFGQRISAKTRSRRTVQETFGVSHPRPLVEKMPLKLSRSLHVVSPIDYSVAEIDETIITANDSPSFICLSSISFIAVSAVFALLLIVLLIFICHRVQKSKLKNKQYYVNKT